MQNKKLTALAMTIMNHIHQSNLATYAYFSKQLEIRNTARARSDAMLAYASSGVVTNISERWRGGR